MAESRRDRTLAVLAGTTASGRQRWHRPQHATTLVERYQPMDIGIADASLIVLAAKYQTTRLLTFDQRHFRAIRPLHAAAFTVLPADGPHVSA